MMIAVCYTLLFAFCGVALSEIVFRKHACINRIWLGLSLGLLLLTWLPCLFALICGFSLPAQILSGAFALCTLAACIVVLCIRHKQKKHNSYRIRNIGWMLCTVLPVIVIGVILLHTHILNRHSDGSVWVGQVTYGDLAMHLGFITSIAEQTKFPPQYSIFPGHALNYPFLCETSGASLYQLGASARQAYIITALYAFILAAFGVYLFFRQWLKKDARAAFATVLFFFGGGFGFFYFFDLAKAGGLLKPLLNTGAQTVSQTLLDGFYQTPTNIPALGLRWVNPIVDMLIPQRATLFGWAFLFPCLYLLHGFSFEQKNENALPLAILAGFLPLIHTHSFLALGVISAVYCISDLLSVRFERTRLIRWAMYAIVTCAIAAPQLLLFTFRQAAESSLVRFHLNWANNADSYIWFYVKNMGMLFVLMPFAFLLLSKRDRRIYIAAVVLWLIAEFIEFQPNDYDNNKLLFIWFAFTCALVAKWLCGLVLRAEHRITKRYTAEQRLKADRIAVHLICFVFVIYFGSKLIGRSEDAIVIPSSTLFTLFFLCGLLILITVRSFMRQRTKRNAFCLTSAFAFGCFWLIALSLCWYRQYAQAEIRFAPIVLIIALMLSMLDLVLAALRFTMQKNRIGRAAFGSLALTLAAYLLIFVTTASSVMTIMRELKSEYQVYTGSEIELSEMIKERTEPDDVILANSYHWNLVTPLTGRSIVTGTGTFLYYHGINTTERESDVRAMYEAPNENLDLFGKYRVKYILISNAERHNYDIDEAFLHERCECVARNSSGELYKLP